MYCSGKKKPYKVLENHSWTKMKNVKPLPWCDEHTSGCPHPDGVILAGSSKEEYCKKVALLNIYTGKVTQLDDLTYNLKNAGMVYDDNTEQLTIVGANPDNGLSSVVLRLPQINEDALWEILKIISYPVINPMLVNDEEYLYVLGGVNSAKCARMSKEGIDNEWVKIKALSDEEEDQLADEYNCNGYSGALVCNETVLVFTRTEFLILENDASEETGTIWKSVQYGTDPNPKPKNPMGNITHLTPMLCNGDILAGIKQEPTKDQKTVKKKIVGKLIENPEGNWHWEHCISAPENAEIGAGRCFSFKVKKDKPDFI